MSENFFNIARHDFLRACATGGASLALLHDFAKTCLSCRPVGKSTGGATEPEKAFCGRDCGLNPRFTFESFVVGATNQVAHEACLALSAVPFKTYNPLFVHGLASSGKTHLLHAIGNRIRATVSGERVVYLTGKQFTNEVRDAPGYQAGRKFRRWFCHAGVVLIDDIQSLAGQVRAQDEFLEAFNLIFDSYGQIIISSDRAPDKMALVAPSLRQRFDWGLGVELLPHDAETHFATLCNRSGSTRIPLSKESIELLAQRKHIPLC